MPDLPLHISEDLSGIGLIPAPVQVLSRNTKLDDEIARQVFWLDLAPFFLPEPEQGGFIVAHDDPGVRAADEIAAGALKLFPHGRFHSFFSTKMLPIRWSTGRGTNSAMWHYHASSAKATVNELSDPSRPSTPQMECRGSLPGVVSEPAYNSTC